MADDGELDGCALDFTADPTPDDEVDAWVLFADVAGNPEAVEERAAEWDVLFGLPTNSDAG